MKRKLTTPGTIHANTRMLRIVNAMLNGVEIKLARSQPIAPVIDRGGGSASIGCIRTKRISATARSPSDMVMKRSSPFHQSHAAVVDVHRQRRAEADRQIDQHGDRDHLDRLPGLIEHRAGEDLNEVRITDRNRE